MNQVQPGIRIHGICHKTKYAYIVGENEEARRSSSYSWSSQLLLLWCVVSIIKPLSLLSITSRYCILHTPGGACPAAACFIHACSPSGAYLVPVWCLSGACLVPIYPFPNPLMHILLLTTRIFCSICRPQTFTFWFPPRYHTRVLLWCSDGTSITSNLAIWNYSRRCNM